MAHRVKNIDRTFEKLEGNAALTAAFGAEAWLAWTSYFGVHLDGEDLGDEVDGRCFVIGRPRYDNVGGRMVESTDVLGKGRTVTEAIKRAAAAVARRSQ